MKDLLSCYDDVKSLFFSDGIDRKIICVMKVSPN